MSRGAVLVTGADGFVGRHLCPALAQRGYKVRGSVQRAELAAEVQAEEVVVAGDLGPDTDWAAPLKDVDAVIHLAARAHVLRETSDNPASNFRRVNVLGTERLARMAASAGVRRLVFLSSIGVNGPATAGSPFTEADEPRPSGPYAASKWEAEERLRAVSAETGLEIAVVRAPLVYGPGVPGNFLRLLGLVKRGLPLPLGSVSNRRSLIYAENLADLLVRCVECPEASGELFLACDDEVLSTPALVRALAAAMGARAALFPCPVALLRCAAAALGRADLIDKLCGSLQVDAGKAMRRLGWKPPVSAGAGLERTARWFLTRRAP